MTTPQTPFIEFDDNQRLSELVGPQDKYLLLIEQRLGVSLALRGNRIAIIGEEPEVSLAKKTLQYLYAGLLKGRSVDSTEIDASIRLVTSSIHLGDHVGAEEGTELAIPTKRRIVFPRSQNQAHYVQAMQSHELAFGIGPAGTGKTYLAVAMGVSLLLAGKIDRIILSRPAVEAGERLGFLPGDMREKVDPYLRPLYDALHDMLPGDQVVKRLSSGEIEVAPLAFMRGRTLQNAFIILDEAQNTTPVQMKMFLTRMGPNSYMVVNGDLTQIDLPIGVLSGLKDALRVLAGVDGISFTHFTDEDVVRHPMVGKVVRAYALDKKKREGHQA